MKKKPKLSVIVIAKSQNEMRPLLDLLQKQTYDNFEIITSTKGTIPEAWNDAIAKASGDFFVFTESDARPVNNNWLSEIAMHVKSRCIIKGIEIRPTDFNLCNTVFDASIFKNNGFKFDESFPICEDSELFARLRKNGFILSFVEAFPVIHIQKISWKNTLKRAFKQGLLYAKIVHMHGLENIDNINTRSFTNNRYRISPVSNRIREIVHNILVMLGVVLGLIIYSPLRIKKENTSGR
ncbi:glycosyltransferase family 2 protein [Neomoorella thermoacetica]|uniref:glycosyltransferase family 2 protein n=1 Tax=Neomoorella thermoacetica TaxID=1525 RepID=UPI0008FB8238|nr:hypothetical protein [Moorella thermoacetica]OIQ52782.1 hypothetical protein MORE_25620 [Moorella thermoacetica]